MWTLYKHISIYNYYYKAKEHLVKFGKEYGIVVKAYGS